MNKFILLVAAILLSATMVKGTALLEGKTRIASFTSLGTPRDILTETDEEGIKYIILQCDGAVETGVKTNNYDSRPTLMSLYGYQIYSLIKSLQEAKDKFPAWQKLATKNNIKDVGIPISVGTSANTIEWSDSVGKIEYIAGGINVGCYFSHVQKRIDNPTIIDLYAETGYNNFSEINCIAIINLTFKEIQTLINILQKLCTDLGIKDNPNFIFFR